jgi:hypothetical protein
MKYRVEYQANFRDKLKEKIYPNKLDRPSTASSAFFFSSSALTSAFFSAGAAAAGAAAATGIAAFEIASSMFTPSSAETIALIRAASGAVPVDETTDFRLLSSTGFPAE